MKPTNKCATAILTALTIFLNAEARETNISGTVTADGKPLEGVFVSDGLNIAKTDPKGRYELASDKKDGTVFVITPSGYVAPSSDNFQPAFWQLLEKGVNEHERHDFKLKKENQDNFSILFITDMHITHDSVKNDRYYFENQTLPLINNLVGKFGKKGPVYAMNLGDFSHDLYWYSHKMPLDKVVEYVAEKKLPAPVYSVSGNHDNDAAIIGDSVDCRSAHLYRRMLGPAQYSINIGNTHWIMLDNIIYKNKKGPKGKGKKAKGIKGDRSYDIGFTDEQLEWLRNDIALVPDTAKVYICCHAPIALQHETLAKPAQMDTIDRIMSRFDNIKIFSGHAHRNVFVQSERLPRFSQHVIVATSGDMWVSSAPYRTLGVDGSDAGLLLASFSKENKNPEIDYFTYVPGNPLFRAYDLNTVGEYYLTNPDVVYDTSIYPQRINYSDPYYANKILINFWGECDDRRIEVIENGKQLKLIKSKIFEDPLYNVCYYVPKTVRERKYNKRDLRLNNAHMYLAAPESATSTLEIRVVDLDGNILQSQKMTRPKPFTTDIK